MGDFTETIQTKTRIFNIGSSSFTNYDTSLSSGLILIPNFIKHSENVNHIYLSITHAEVANSFYLINEYNNILNINDIDYSLAYGNYNISSLISSLLLLIPSNISLLFNSIIQKITLSSPVPFTISYSKSTINRIMGLSRTNDMIAIFSDQYKITLPNCVCFLPTSRINFRSSSLNLENYPSDLFLSLQNNASQNGIILYTNNDSSRFHINLESINELNIRVTDDSNRELNFNGINWFLTLRVDYEYKIIDTKNSFSKILKKNNELLKYLEDLNDE